MMTVKEAAQFKRWTAVLPSGPSVQLDAEKLIHTNEAFKELCDKLLSVLAFGNRELRIAAVTSLVLFQDSALSGVSIDFSQNQNLVEPKKPARKKAKVAA